MLKNYRNILFLYLDVIVDEAKGVCKDRSRWHSVVSAYPHGKKA